MSTDTNNPMEEPAAGNPASGDAPAREYRELVLVKNGQRYIFRYTLGEEAKLLAGLTEMVRDPGSDLDWFDAAVLSHQVGRNMGMQIGRPKGPQNGAA